MADRRDHKRVLIYSHDSFGLGHLRRCRAIAHSLVEADSSASVLILSGSPIIGSFDFRSRVDFVRIPGVIKLRNGEYVSLNLHIDIEETLAMRSSIIRHTADIFDPDLLIVDKEPLGLRGEVRPTLDLLRDARHAADPRPARRDGRSERARNRVGAQERGPGAERILRRDLGLRPAADLRPARGDRSAGERAPAHGLYRLSAAPGRRGGGGQRSTRAACRRRFPAGHRRRRRRRRGADRLGAGGLRARSRRAAAGADRLRPVHAARAPGRLTTRAPRVSPRCGRSPSTRISKP